MTVTVETLLRDKSMQGCKVKAGEPGLQNEVTWIHIGEVVDMGDWLQGGEFLLSCIHGPGDDKDKQIEFLRGLNEANISALGIEVGYYFNTMPSYLMAEANRFNLPLIQIPPGRPFVEITQALLPRITEARELNSEEIPKNKISLKKMIESELHEAIIQQKFQKALELIDDFCYYLANLRKNPRGVRFYLLQALQEIFTSSLELKADIIRIYRSYLALYNNLKRISNPQKYLDYAGIALKDMISLVQISTEGQYNPYIQQAFKFMFDNYNDPDLKIADIADKIGISSSHLNYLFRTETKLPPKKILTNIRIESSMHYLYYTDMPLKSIAARTGFSNPSYFSRVFKKEVGLPPSEYRKLMN